MEYTVNYIKEGGISPCFDSPTTDGSPAQRSHKIYVESEFERNIEILARLV